jgi:23S rRNA pseudoU1915 N3-methylase RlmH
VDMDPELKSYLSEMKAELKAEMSEMKADLRAEMSEMKAELKADTAMLRSEFKSDLADMKIELKAHTEMIETRLLSAFWQWSKTTDARARQQGAVITGVDERLSIIEQRVTNLEQRR